MARVVITIEDTDLEDDNLDYSIIGATSILKRAGTELITDEDSPAVRLGTFLNEMAKEYLEKEETDNGKG